MSRRALVQADQFDQTWSVVLDRAAAVGSTLDLNFVCGTAATRLDALAVTVSLPAGLGVAQTTGASGPRGQELEELQVLLGEGPSLDGLRGDQSSIHVDLTERETQARWPSFARAAYELGVGAVHVTAMRAGAIPIGILAVYLERTRGPGSPLSAEARAFAATAELVYAADLVSARRGIERIDAILGLRARAFMEERPLSSVCAEVVLSESGADQSPLSALGDVLEQRRDIQQAVGVLMHSGPLSAPAAHAALREMAADGDLPAHEMAAEVLGRARAEIDLGPPSP